MRIVIVAVGKLNDPAAADLLARYGQRLQKGISLAWLEVPAVAGKSDPRRALALEAERIRERIPQGAYVVALSERGREMDSKAFAAWLGRLANQGRDLCFLIGGAPGLHAALLGEADEVVSLSRLTFPHELARPILAEQLYRAFSILRGEPYHRE
jgi:23S rRNA (pseudouridine1915-N3)-methyltransferase